MVIKTSSLAYDDRLRKEIDSCRSAGLTVSVHAGLDDNRNGTGLTWSDTPFRNYRIWSRYLLPGHRFVALHILEFLLQLACRGLWRARRGERRVVWLHDPVLLPFVPALALGRRLGLLQRLIWDHHELPPESWLKRAPFHRFLRSACSMPDALICANTARVDYLHSRGVLDAKQLVCVVRNYADRTYANQPIRPLPLDLCSWLEGQPYLFVQSGGQPLRHVEAMLEAVFSSQWPALKVVMAGGCAHDILERYRVRFPDQFARLIWLQGQVPQMDFPQFVDHALGSLVLYRANSPNQLYCEPNRLYQSLCRGVPVVVGNNPPMAEVIKRTQAGVVLDDDGANSAGITAAVIRLLTESTPLRLKASEATTFFTWEAQQQSIDQALGLSGVTQ